MILVVCAVVIVVAMVVVMILLVTVAVMELTVGMVLGVPPAANRGNVERPAAAMEVEVLLLITVVEV